MKKYRQSGGVPPSNTQMRINEEMEEYEINFNIVNANL